MQWDEHRIAENHQGDRFTNNFHSAHHLRWCNVGVACIVSLLLSQRGGESGDMLAKKEQPFDPHLTGLVAGSPPPLLPLPFPWLQLGSLAAADLSGGVQSVDVAPSAAHIADAPQVPPGTTKAQAAELPPPLLSPPPFPPPSPPPTTVPLALNSQASNGMEMAAPDAGQPTLVVALGRWRRGRPVDGAPVAVGNCDTLPMPALPAC